MIRIKEIAVVFLKLGIISFGGPAVHIAIMEKEVVGKRRWLTQEHFLDLLGATNLIPGPNSTEMAIHCGYIRGGKAGLVIAGICFILPAVIITLLFAWFYKEYGKLPSFQSIFFGVKPAVIAIILGAATNFGKKAVKNFKLACIGLGVLIASLSGLNEIIVLLIAGISGMVLLPALSNKIKSFVPFLLLPTVAIAERAYGRIFIIFLKIGCVLFGSGYVLFAYLDDELVRKLGWLSRKELMDAIAIGQFTPGPVLSSATFIGYQLSGLQGAALATAGIFAPAFVFVWLLKPLIPRIRKSIYASAFLDAVNVATVAIMLTVCIKWEWKCFPTTGDAK